MAKPLVEPHLFLDQQVTDILFSGRNIKEVTLNGQTKIAGELFYFSDKLPLIFKKLGAQLGKQARQFAKIQWYSSILLTIHHRQTPKKFLPDQLYLLTGSKGQVFPGMFSWIQKELISRWQSFFPQEWIHSPESTGALLKEMRKQIQRAFISDPVESIHGEFISIQDPVFADSGKTSFQNGKLSDFNNLFINSPCLSPSVGWVHQGLGSLFSSIPRDQEKPESRLKSQKTLGGKPKDPIQNPFSPHGGGCTTIS